MSISEAEKVGCSLVLIAVAAIVGTVYGCSIKEYKMHRDAIKAGAAEWETNKEGSVEFKWKGNSENEDNSGR